MVSRQGSPLRTCLSRLSFQTPKSSQDSQNFEISQIFPKMAKIHFNKIVNTWNSIFHGNGFTTSFAFENLSFPAWFPFQYFLKSSQNSQKSEFAKNYQNSLNCLAKWPKIVRNNTWNSIFQGNGFTASFSFENLSFPFNCFFQHFLKSSQNGPKYQNFSKISKILKSNSQKMAKNPSRKNT